MPLDAGLYANIGRGQRTWQDMAAADQAMEANKLTMLLRQQQADEARATAAEREALRGYFSTPGLDMDSPDFEAGLYRSAPGLATGVQKQRADIIRARTEGVGKREEAERTRLANVASAVAMHRDQLANVTDGATAAQWLMAGYADPLVGPVLSRMGPASEAIKRIPQDPDGLANWVKQNGLGATKFIEKNAPSYDVQNTGKTTETVARPGLGGAPTVVRSVQNTPTPGQTMADATIRRGQDIAAGTARETGGTLFTDKDGNTFVVNTRAPASAPAAAPGPAPAPGAAPAAAPGPRPRVATPIVSPDGKPLVGKTPRTAMSATLQKELIEADDMAAKADSVVKTLRQALTLNDTAYSGAGAELRAKIRSNLPGESEAANATVNLVNMIGEQALSNMKAIFGGNPTEGERAILLELQASADKTPSQRKAIIDRAIDAAEARQKLNRARAKAIRGGTYLSDQPAEEEPPGDEPPAVDLDALRKAVAAEAARRSGRK